MKVPVTREERNLSYFKYFERDLAPIPEEILKMIDEGPADPSVILPFSRRMDFVAGTDEDYCQNGYCVMQDGTAAICASLHMPGVSPEMLDWWFPWHSVGSDLRYKIWDPEDHYFATAHPAGKVLDPSVPLSQKTWDVTHYIMEDVGFGPQFVRINFVRPGDAGIDEKLVGTEKCAGLVCGIGLNSGTTMIHKWYPEKDGVIFKSRFWIGWGYLKDKLMGKCLPDGVSIPPEFCRKMFHHAHKEYTNLMSILPELYLEEKDNW